MPNEEMIIAKNIDELSKIHRQSFVQINNIDNMVTTFPKLYRLVKASDAKAVSFFTIEG